MKWSIKGEMIEKKGSEKYRVPYNIDIIFPRRNVDVMKGILKRKLLTPALKDEFPTFYRLRTFFIDNVVPANKEEANIITTIMSKDIDEMSLSDVVTFSLVQGIKGIDASRLSSAIEARHLLREKLSEMHDNTYYRAKLSGEDMEGRNLDPIHPGDDSDSSNNDSPKNAPSINSTLDTVQGNPSDTPSINSTLDTMQGKPASKKPATRKRTRKKAETVEGVELVNLD